MVPWSPRPQEGHHGVQHGRRLGQHLPSRQHHRGAGAGRPDATGGRGSPVNTGDGRDFTGKNGKNGRLHREKWRLWKGNLGKMGRYHGFTREKWRSGDDFLCF